MKAFVNTYLGETWEEQGDSIEAVALMSRLEDYDPHSMIAPLPWRLITAGVDVQKNRLEASIVGWGEKEEAWLLDHLILPGDTAENDVWQDLAVALRDARVQLAVVDSGYNASSVYAFCSAHRWAVPGKGMAGTARPLIEDERRRAARLRRRVRRQHVVEPIGVDQGKALIYARLKLEAAGPGYIHFPRTPAFDDEYFAQLAAEKLVTRLRGSRPFTEWVQIRARNESLDCFDEKTEVLTRDGWRYFSDLAMDDQLATVNLDTDHIEYQLPQALIGREYGGPMVHLKGERLDVMVTPNHRMVTYKKKQVRMMDGTRRWMFDVPPEITLAKDLTIHHQLKLHATWRGNDIQTVTIPASESVQGWQIEPQREVNALDMAAFLGWFVSEGSTGLQTLGKSIRRRVAISQNKQHNRTTIESLLDRLPWRWHASGDSYMITSKQLFDYVRPLGRYQHERIVPDWIKQAGSAVIASFVDAAILGDGWVQQKKTHHRVSRAYATTSQRLADDMQELFIKLGHAATMRVVQPKLGGFGRITGAKTQYHVYERLTPKASLDGGGQGKRQFLGKTVHYKGRVYCATVPNGTLIVRRGGKTFVAGNCLVYSLAAMRLSRVNLSQPVVATTESPPVAATRRPARRRIVSGI